MSFHCAVHASVIVYYVIIIVCVWSWWLKSRTRVRCYVRFERASYHLFYNHVITSKMPTMYSPNLPNLYNESFWYLSVWQMSHVSMNAHQKRSCRSQKIELNLHHRRPHTHNMATHPLPMHLVHSSKNRVTFTTSFAWTMIDLLADSAVIADNYFFMVQVQSLVVADVLWQKRS